MSPKIDTLKIQAKLLDREIIKHIDKRFDTDLFGLSALVICPVRDVTEIVIEDLIDIIIDFTEDTVVTLRTD